MKETVGLPVKIRPDALLGYLTWKHGSKHRLPLHAG